MEYFKTDNFELAYEITETNEISKEFVVKLLNGEWPSEEELICICSNNNIDLLLRKDFGGFAVKETNEIATVKVYNG
jgi:hypothetical protein